MAGTKGLLGFVIAALSIVAALVSQPQPHAPDARVEYAAMYTVAGGLDLPDQYHANRPMWRDQAQHGWTEAWRRYLGQVEADIEAGADQVLLLKCFLMEPIANDAIDEGKVVGFRNGTPIVSRAYTYNELHEQNPEAAEAAAAELVALALDNPEVEVVLYGGVSCWDAPASEWSTCFTPFLDAPNISFGLDSLGAIGTDTAGYRQAKMLMDHGRKVYAEPIMTHGEARHLIDMGVSWICTDERWKTMLMQGERWPRPRELFHDDEEVDVVVLLQGRDRFEELETFTRLAPMHGTLTLALSTRGMTEEAKAELFSANDEPLGPQSFLPAIGPRGPPAGLLATAALGADPKPGLAEGDITGVEIHALVDVAFTNVTYTHATKTVTLAGAFDRAEVGAAITFTSGTGITPPVADTIATVVDEDSITLTTGLGAGADGSADLDGTYKAGSEPYGACIDVAIEDFTTGITVNFGSGTGNPLDHDDIGSATVVLTVTSQGYNSSGVLGTVTRTVYATEIVRQADPNDANNEEPVAGTIRLALSDFIYDDDTVTITIAAAAFTDAGDADATNAAVTDLACTNSSTLDYPKVVGKWDRVAGSITGDRITSSTFQLAARCYHRFGIAAVEFDVDGTTSSNNENDRVTSTVSKQRSATNLYVQSYQTSAISTASFTDNEEATINFIAYPVVGDENSLLDTSTNTTASEECLGHNQGTIVIDPDDDLTVYAIVSTAGNDGTGVASSTLATAEASPFLSVGEAHEAGANVIYGLDGTHDIIGDQADAQTTTTEWIVVTFHPTSSSKANCKFTVATAKNYNCQRLQYKNVTIEMSGDAYLDGTGGTNHLRFNGCTFDGNNTGAPTLGLGLGRRSNVTYFDNCDGDLGEREWPFSIFSDNLENYCFDGCDFPQPTNAKSSEIQSCWEFVGCTVTGNHVNELLSDTVSGGSPVFGRVEVSFNRILDWSNNNEIVSYNNGWDTSLVIVGNVFERQSGTGPNLLLAVPVVLYDESSEQLIFWHNTSMGQRENWGYNDTGTIATAHRNWSVLYNVNEDTATKHDDFGTGSGKRVGGWPVMYAVGWRFNHRQQATALFPGEYEGLGIQTGSPSFVNDESLNGGGAGGGDYTPASGSPLLGKVPVGERVVFHDLNGKAVASTVAADIGAIQVTSDPSAVDEESHFHRGRDRGRPRGETMCLPPKLKLILDIDRRKAA